jgi:transposase
MLRFVRDHAILQGPSGSLSVPDDDEITRKLAMLFEGHCENLGPKQAAKKFGYSPQRYFQLLHEYQSRGADALRSRKRGPKTLYRRTQEIICQIIRHRFLDPDASAAVIAQKLRQCGCNISTRSVERVVATYGLQKKTPRVPTHKSISRHPDAPHEKQTTPRSVRSGQPRTRRAATAG